MKNFKNIIFIIILSTAVFVSGCDRKEVENNNLENGGEQEEVVMNEGEEIEAEEKQTEQNNEVKEIANSTTESKLENSQEEIDISNWQTYRSEE